MSDNAALRDLAQRLWEARRDGALVDRDGLIAPETSEASYAVQAEIVRLSGERSRGFKVGSTSKEAQAKLGTTEPGSAPLLARWFHESPARIALVPGQDPSLEGEFAFRLGADLPPRGEPYEMSEVRAAIEAVAPAIEVVGSRIRGGLGGVGRFLSTADCGVNIALVVGAWSPFRPDTDLRDHGVAMLVNGETRGSGTGARALGDPLNVMVWLANQQSAWRRGLKRGDVVSTGTCTGLDSVRPGDRALADFGALGNVEIALD
ncbi:MAG: fumarylacetoacetate hydrolase family protein [Proteobacteria bacterium]|nr:fumarylacetoacetate hydrolase family protein [Pseudomonadota bacterium]